MTSVEDVNPSSDSDTEKYYDSVEPERTLLDQIDRTLLNQEANIITRILKKSKDNCEIPLLVHEIDRELVALEEKERQRIEASNRFGKAILAARKLTRIGKQQHRELKVWNEERKIALIKAKEEANGNTAEGLENIIKTEPTSFNPSDSVKLDPIWLREKGIEKYKNQQRQKKERARKNLHWASTDRPVLPLRKRGKGHVDYKKRSKYSDDLDKERSEVGCFNYSENRKRIGEDECDANDILMNTYKRAKT